MRTSLNLRLKRKEETATSPDQQEMSMSARKFRPSWTGKPFTPLYHSPGSTSSDNNSAAKPNTRPTKKFPFYTANDFQPAIATTYVPPTPFCLETNEFFQQESTRRQLAEASTLRYWTCPVWLKESSIEKHSLTLLPFQSGLALWVPMCGKEFVHICALGMKNVAHALREFPVPEQYRAEDYLVEGTDKFESTLVLDETPTGGAVWLKAISLLHPMFAVRTRDLLRRKLIATSRIEQNGRVFLRNLHPFTSMYISRSIARQVMGLHAATTAITSYHYLRTPPNVGVFYNGCQFEQTEYLNALTERVLTTNHPAQPPQEEESAAVQAESEQQQEVAEKKKKVYTLVSGRVLADHGGMNVDATIPASLAGEPLLFHDLGATGSALRDDDTSSRAAMICNDEGAVVDEVADADYLSAAQAQPTADFELAEGAISYALAHNTASEQGSAVLPKEETNDDITADAELRYEAGAMIAAAHELVSERLGSSATADVELILEAESTAAALMSPSNQLLESDLEGQDTFADSELVSDVITSSRDASGVVTRFLTELPVQAAVRTASSAPKKFVASPMIPPMASRGAAFAPRGAA